jgi:hypothetical protein
MTSTRQKRRKVQWEHQEAYDYIIQAMYKPTAMKRPLLEKFAEAEPTIYNGLMLVACSTGASATNIRAMLECSDNSGDEFDMVYKQLYKQRDWTILVEFLKGESPCRIYNIVRRQATEKQYKFIAKLAAAGIRITDEATNLSRVPGRERAKLMAAGVQGPNADKIRVREIAACHQIHPFVFKLF